MNNSNSQNIDTFLNLFNDIDGYLRRKYRINRKNSFPKVLDMAKESDIKNRDDYEVLSNYAQLRNLLVHNNEMIVEIHPNFVASMKRIHKNVMPSNIVSSKFNTKVATFKTSDNLTAILRVINERNFSQFPIYHDNLFAGLLTENGITKWLSKNFQRQNFSIDLVTAGDILEIEENKDNVEFIDQNRTIEDAKDIFSYHLSSGKPTLDALLITQSGKHTEELLGIITRWDVIES